MTNDITIKKPEPIALNENLELYNRSTSNIQTIQRLEAGEQVLISEFYSNGISLLKALQSSLKRKLPNKTFQEQRAFRAEYHRLSNLVLVEIKDHKLEVKKSPSIGWLEKLYPESSHFLLTFPQVQGLNSSWQWYEKGVLIPMLRNKIKPFYGTYFPTRFDHLGVFDNWLKRYTGPKKTAIDVGFGSGVLSLQMVKHGFQKIFGTDINPNAVVGFTAFMGDTKLSRKIELDLGHLFGKWEKQTELIVFNPPWLPATHDLDGIDEAIYYKDNLFPEFFAEAKKRLLPDGKLLILFSNLAQIANLTKDHPVETELAEGGRFKLERCFKKKVKDASEKTTRDQNWRADEEVELWVLTN